MARSAKAVRPRNKKVVKRRAKPLRRYKTKFVGDDRIRAQWDHKLTTRQNYDNLGLAANPNALQELRKSVEGSESVFNEDDETAAAPRFHVPDSDFLSERNPRRADNYMSSEEIKYLRRLVAKHGDDHEAMARDIKTNDMQWTTNKLRRRCARLALLDAQLIHNRGAVEAEAEAKGVAATPPPTTG